MLGHEFAVLLVSACLIVCYAAGKRRGRAEGSREGKLKAFIEQRIEAYTCGVCPLCQGAMVYGYENSERTAGLNFVKVRAENLDCIVIEPLRDEVVLSQDEWSAVAARMCDRHLGIGSQSLALILPSTVADCRLSVFGQDGHSTDACTEVLRCSAAYVFGRDRLSRSKTLAVECASGVRSVRVQITVDKGLAAALLKTDVKADEGGAHRAPVDDAGAVAVVFHGYYALNRESGGSSLGV